MISQSTIDRVRDRADIVAVISETVPSLKRRGRSFVGLCPFHKEKTGSFHVNPDRGFFHCFGCKESGSVIDFIMKQEGATFPEAVRSLAERYNIEIEEDRAQERPEQDRPKKLRDDLYTVNQVAAAFFESEIWSNPHGRLALAELEKRGLPFKQQEDGGGGDEVSEVLRGFRMGYAPSGWDGLATHLKKHGVSPFAAEQVGLLVPRSGGTGHYDRFRNRLMFAVVDEKGRVVAFSGRALPPVPGTEEKESPAKYINSPESPIYTKGHTLFGLHQARHAIRQEEEAILVEGNFDVVSLHARGIQNVVAPLGTAFTPEQAKLLKRFAPNVVLAFDGDAAGKKATEASRSAIRDAGLTARVIRLPYGMDPDELVRTRAKKGFEDALAAAKALVEHMIEVRLDEFKSASPIDRVRLLEEINDLIKSDDRELVRIQLYALLDTLVRRLELHGLVAGSDDAQSPNTVSFATVERAVKRAAEADRAARGPVVTPREAKVKSRPAGSEERTAIIQALIECPDLLLDPEIEAELGLLEGPGVEVVLALRKAWDFETRRLHLESFFEALPPKLLGRVKEMLASPQSQDEKEAKKNLLDNAKKLKSVLLAQSTNELARENYSAEGTFDEGTEERGRLATERMRERHGVKVS